MAYEIDPRIEMVINKEGTRFRVGDIFTESNKFIGKFGLFLVLGFVKHSNDRIPDVSVVYRSMNDSCVGTFHITSRVSEYSRKVI